ncbi:NADPH-dependent F420 reductase [Arthrobacter mobilis]|uniref:NAD(P)-binding domain-containing protein n=1 Tax=Arthrobacter mobilis TaxID=2724944 RepID=A0A7X6HEC2_9MICC|nr:NAD(P)-binding domain-containing protein [Arthrobacter mobilis]NKX54107.1 NAD(P)-binding domain-containing protein [Arthrobacter mobilis]
MKISVIGTGLAGRALAAKIAHAGHAVVLGTRDPDQTLARTETSPTGAPPIGPWHDAHRNIPLVALAEAGGHGELIVNATAGTASLAALHATAPHDGKIIMDVANPLDFSRGFPPTLSVCNTDSLAEQIQREFPAARVVKTFNTMNHLVMVDPHRLPRPHNVFVAGDDPGAKATVSGLLEQIGWPPADILDLGGISSARAMEMYLPLWLALLQSLGSWDFNIRIVRPEQSG